jgi:hypothetical protein
VLIGKLEAVIFKEVLHEDDKQLADKPFFSIKPVETV